jgi:tetratricopeptide (TPR) repeat protein
VSAVAARETAPAAPPATGSPSPIAMTSAAIGSRPAATWLLDQYDHGERSTGAVRLKAEDLWAVVGDLRKSAPAWIRTRGSAPVNDEARRRLLVATYVLELINAQDEFVWQPPLSVSDLLEWAGGVLREVPALPAERTWYLAAVSLLERLQPGLTPGAGGQLETVRTGSFVPETLASVDVDPLVTLLSHAEHRFPDEPRWALVRAISEELQTWPERRDDGTFSVAANLASRLTSRFREAAAQEPTRQEAQLRWGYFELRRGRVDDALSHFELAGTPDDVFLRYWLHLFKGRALEQKNRPADALAAYRLAFEDVPYAQSATVSLGAALVAEHRPSEAAALITRMLAMRPAPPDPWTLYTFPDLRFWPQLLAELQKAIVS